MFSKKDGVPYSFAQIEIVLSFQHLNFLQNWFFGRVYSKLDRNAFGAYDFSHSKVTVRQFFDCFFCEKNF